METGEKTPVYAKKGTPIIGIPFERVSRVLREVGKRALLQENKGFGTWSFGWLRQYIKKTSKKQI